MFAIEDRVQRQIAVRSGMRVNFYAGAFTSRTRHLQVVAEPQFLPVASNRRDRIALLVEPNKAIATLKPQHGQSKCTRQFASF